MEKTVKFETGDSVAPYINPNPTNGTYTIPVAGYYHVSAKMLEWVPTGSFDIVPNVNKKWWQFWKPTYIRQEIHVPKDTRDGIQVRFYNKGDVLPVNDYKHIYRLR